jgi:hypothetical protein
MAREITADWVMRHCKSMQRRYRLRDSKWSDVRAVRRGELDINFPDLVSDAFPEPIVTFIDPTARDLAEMLAPLPSFNCSSVSMRNDTERKRADLRTRIALNYVNHSRLGEQMLMGADQYFTYGMCVLYVEPDYKAKLPRIVIEDAEGGYPEYDRWGRILSYTKRWWADAGVLADLYPEYADQIVSSSREISGGDENRTEMIRYWDDDGQTLIFAGKHAAILDYVPNRTRDLPMVIARRPWLDGHTPRGQFDGIVWTELAADELAKLTLEMVQKQVQAPLAVPPDVQEVSYGPDAIIRSATPEKIKRVGMEATNLSFVENNSLTEQMRLGARYPATRAGVADASVITGRGVAALQGGLDSQISSGQEVFRNAFVDVMSICFKTDEVVWPSKEKQFRGIAEGVPYDVAYTPKRDIDGNYSCDVTYGIASGMDPARAIVMLLQLRAEKCFSRDFMTRQLPFEINTTEETAKVAVEDTREALLQSVFGYAQALPAMAAQGMDPSDAVAKLAMIVKGLQKGKSVEDVVAEAFKPPAAPPQAAADATNAPTPGPGEGSVPPGPGGAGGGPGGALGPSGLMQGVAPGQAGMAPGGRPDIQTLLAGLTGGGKPSMSARVQKQRRV